MKPWQLGYDMDTLKGLAAPFKQYLKPLILGAFGVPNERDIADALARKEVAWVGGSVPTSALLFRKLTQASTHRDFAGNAITMPAGSVYIRNVAGSPAGIADLLAKFLPKLGACPLYVEAWEELPGARAAIEANGMRWLTSKVAASSEIKGIYSNRGLSPLLLADIPALAILQQDFITANDLSSIAREINAYGNRWAQHYSSYNKGKSWTAFALKGFGNAAFIEKPAEMSRGWQALHPDKMDAKCAWTDAAEHFRATLLILAGKLPGVRMQRIRLMRLAPGRGELTRHADITDAEAGTRDGKLMRLHIPIATNAGCIFKGWDLRGNRIEAQFPERALCYLDTRKPHAVVNTGATQRIHIVADCYATPALRAMLK